MYLLYYKYTMFVFNFLIKVILYIKIDITDFITDEQKKRNKAIDKILLHYNEIDIPDELDPTIPDSKKPKES